jgi:hypothetical protein
MVPMMMRNKFFQIINTARLRFGDVDVVLGRGLEYKCRQSPPSMPGIPGRRRTRWLTNLRHTVDDNDPYRFICPNRFSPLSTRLILFCINKKISPLLITLKVEYLTRNI